VYSSNEYYFSKIEANSISLNLHNSKDDICPQGSTQGPHVWFSKVQNSVKINSSKYNGNDVEEYG
jgi:hypothetical protein